MSIAARAGAMANPPQAPVGSDPWMSGATAPAYAADPGAAQRTGSSELSAIGELPLWLAGKPPGADDALLLASQSAIPGGTWGWTASNRAGLLDSPRLRSTSSILDARCYGEGHHEDELIQAHATRADCRLSAQNSALTLSRARTSSASGRKLCDARDRKTGPNEDRTRPFQSG